MTTMIDCDFEDQTVDGFVPAICVVDIQKENALHEEYGGKLIGSPTQPGVLNYGYYHSTHYLTSYLRIYVKFHNLDYGSSLGTGNYLISYAEDDWSSNYIASVIYIDPTTKKLQLWNRMATHSGATMWDQGTTVLQEDRVYRIEVKYYAAFTNGYIQVRINGVEDIYYIAPYVDGYDIVGGAFAWYVNTFKLGPAIAEYTNYDCIEWNDTGWPGACPGIELHQTLEDTTLAGLAVHNTDASLDVTLEDTVCSASTYYRASLNVVLDNTTLSTGLIKNADLRVSALQFLKTFRIVLPFSDGIISNKDRAIVLNVAAYLNQESTGVLAITLDDTILTANVYHELFASADITLANTTLIATLQRTSFGSLTVQLEDATLDSYLAHAIEATLNVTLEDTNLDALISSQASVWGPALQAG